MECPRDYNITVTNVTFGRGEETVCSGRGVAAATCAPRDVADSVRTLCEGRNICRFNITEDTFGTHCPGVLKQLDVEFNCTCELHIEVVIIMPEVVDCRR